MAAVPAPSADLMRVIWKKTDESSEKCGPECLEHFPWNSKQILTVASALDQRACLKTTTQRV
jgi:hypothetical protein